MPACVAIDGAGYVVEVAETFPQCTQLVIADPSYFERLTYWADLSIQLDPAGTDLYLLMSATLLVFIIAWGWKAVARQIFNR